jgi:hypothetical protein
MQALKRFWQAYLRFVNYTPRPVPFSGTTPKYQSTTNP